MAAAQGRDCNRVVSLGSASPVSKRRMPYMHLGMRNIAESVIELKNRKPCSILVLDEGRDENTPFWRAAAPDALGDGDQVLLGSSPNTRNALR